MSENELVERLRGHAMGLSENARYDPGAPSGLTNHDAVSYGELLQQAADAIAALSSRSLSEGEASGPEPSEDGAISLLRDLLRAQTVKPYRGWNITKLNKAADAAREALGMQSVLDANPDIADMIDHALANKEAFSALASTPAREPSDMVLVSRVVVADLAAIGPRPNGRALGWVEPRPCFYGNLDMAPCGYCTGCRERIARETALNAAPAAGEGR